MQWVPSHYQATHDMSALPFHYDKLCQVVKVTPTISGNQMRLKLTNRFGRHALLFNDVQIASTPHFTAAQQVTSHYQSQIIIPEHSVIRTDPITFPIKVGQPVYIKMIANHPQEYVDFASTYQTMLTNAALSRQSDFIPPLTERWRNRKGWFSLESLEVSSSINPVYVEITGDSLVESGMVVAEMIRGFNQSNPNQLCWLQTGISGNQLCHDAPMEEPLYETFGRSLLKRLQKSTLRPNMTIAIIGTNDLILPFYSKTMAEQNVTPQEIISGYQKLAAICRARQSKLLTTTIAPLRLFDVPDPLPAEQIITSQRRTINTWLRQRSWIVDGARQLRDAHDNLTAKYDFGDHLHWSPAGGQEIAKLLIPQVKKLVK